ncbi:MAG: acetate kinase, partial [Pseudomonadota bacterium]
ALPENLREMGLRRYGFHGLSYQWIAQTLAQDYPNIYQNRVVAAHLGNGASVCALLKGQSIDSSMGLTALDGLPMGTRSGSVDPGLILYLAKDLKMPPHDIEDILYNQSGLLGLSGISNDVEILLKSENPKAKFALDVFCLKAAQAIA